MTFEEFQKILNYLENSNEKSLDKLEIVIDPGSYGSVMLHPENVILDVDSEGNTHIVIEVR